LLRFERWIFDPLAEHSLLQMQNFDGYCRDTWSVKVYADKLSRRKILIGSASVIGSDIVPAYALAPQVMAGIGIVTGLWNAYKVAEDVWDRLFKPDKKQPIIIERERILVERQYIVVPELFELRNPYKFREFGDSEPGCHCYHRRIPEASALFCGGHGQAVAITAGFSIVLAHAVEKLRARYADDNVAAYTRPVKYYKQLQPWRVYGDGGKGVVTEMSYYSPAGTIVLQWSLPNSQGPKSYAYCNIRDNSSGRVVSEFDGYFNDRG
jgi:hypothetical protein